MKYEVIRADFDNKFENGTLVVRQIPSPLLKIFGAKQKDISYNVETEFGLPVFYTPAMERVGFLKEVALFQIYQFTIAHLKSRESQERN